MKNVTLLLSIEEFKIRQQKKQNSETSPVVIIL